jgi:hypothetical protein
MESIPKGRYYWRDCFWRTDIKDADRRRALQGPANRSKGPRRGTGVSPAVLAADGRDAHATGGSGGSAKAERRRENAGTNRLLEAARIIAGAKLCICNQSSLHAIAEGLDRPCILEVSSQMPNCIFNRPGKINGFDKNVLLPALDI